MKAILLPGHSKSNKTWIHDLAFSLNPLVSSLSIQHYNHWHTSEDLHVGNELATLTTHVPDDRNFILVAKSVGVGLSLAAIQTKKLKPRACVFIGTPLNLKQDQLDITRLLKEHRIPTLFIQKERDPYGSSTQLKKLINAPHRVRSLKGSDHSYHDIDGLHNEIKQFLHEQRLL